MTIVHNLILIIQILSALTMIGLILVQHGKGADMGAAFGSGSAGSLFGASGSANFLSRSTAVAAVVFFVCTLALAYFGNLRVEGSNSVLDRALNTAPVTAPAAPVDTGPASQIPGNTPAAKGAAAPAASGSANVPAPAPAPKAP
ncbi:preprotein translocase subunit SecG [Xylophilus rhododendri]|uniref:Protein-export membrane protein SecG n=1 Tax=Xylophilus rhododendri TaxID=2697032 RepID=A0A857JBW8_9BURK|nr:preprotein translocase subunit SecG [Xylophilus rhododendri]QHJ01168.1 preprotein translocase subunit SecG [Xylophilus rhododendri]